MVPITRRCASASGHALHAASSPRPAPPSRSSAAVRPTASASTQRAARRTALAIPSAPELPWPTTAMPRSPSRIAPPVVSGCSSRRRPPSAGRISSPPSAASGFERAASRIAPVTVFAVPSISFRATLPVKPSVTTTSATPLGRSRPSTLPANSIPAEPERISWAATTSSRPLPASSPTESRPTRGRSTPSTAALKAAPRKANWTRCWARTSTLAPTSRKSTRLPGTGSCTARAGRCTPFSRRRPKVAAAIAAPVEPALTIASARPSATSAAARTTEASFLARTAATGSSSLPIDSAVGTTSIPSTPFKPELDRPGRRPAAGSRPPPPSARPRRARQSPARPRTHPGPRSRRAPRALLRVGGRRRRLGDGVFDHLTPRVGAAGRADAMRQAGAVAARAAVQPRLAGLVVRAPLVAAGA